VDGVLFYFILLSPMVENEKAGRASKKRKPFREPAWPVCEPHQPVREWARPRPDTSPGGGFLLLSTSSMRFTVLVPREQCPIHPSLELAASASVTHTTPQARGAVCHRRSSACSWIDRDIPHNHRQQEHA
jgi:hypothetical protein